MPHTNYEELAKKINRMFEDLRIKNQAIDALEKSLTCHKVNVQRSENALNRYKLRCALMEQFLNKIPLDEKRIMLERNAHPRMRVTFYAERANLSLKRYEEKAKEASTRLADMLAAIPGWEDI